MITTVKPQPEPAVIYILAGILTVPGFFTHLAEGLQHRYQIAGSKADIAEHFPYGTHKVSLRRQLQEIVYDLSLSPRRATRSIGGHRLVRQVLQEHVIRKREGVGVKAGRKIILIGHSAGAVSASLAASILQDRYQITVHRIIFIGSPKVKVAEIFRDRTLSLVQHKWWWKDWPNYIGRWGGWKRHRFRYDRFKYAPMHRINLPTIGKHQDYFRNAPPFVSHLGTNLDITLEPIWQHIISP